MSKVICKKCASKMKMVSSGNVDDSTWEEDRKGSPWLGRRFRKLKGPSRYRAVFKCEKGNCGERETFRGRSKALVNAHLNRRWAKGRYALITADAERRKLEEAIERKRQEQDRENG